MRKYIWQEFKRVLIKKKFLIIITFIFIAVLGAISVSRTKTYEEQLQQHKMLINNLKTSMDKADTDIKKSGFSKDIADNQKIITDLESKLDDLNNYDSSKLDEKIQSLEKQNDPKNEYKINQLKYNKDHNIQKNNLIPKGVYKSFDMLASFFPIILLFILIMILSDIVSGEYSPNTIKLLVTKSISREKIVMSKFIVSIFLSICAIITSSIIFILESCIYLGTSDYKLPFDIGSKYILDKSLPLTTISSQMKYVSQSRTFIPISIALLILILLFIVSSISIISIIMFISTISKNSLIAVFINLILIFGSGALGFVNLTAGYIKGAKYGVIYKFLPITYMIDTIDVLTGDICLRINHSISIFFPILVCLVWAVIMMFLSTYIFAKKDFD